MLETVNTVIGGTEYKVTKLPYKLGRGLLLRLYKTLGPAFADAIKEAPSKLPEGGLAAVSVLELLPALASGVHTLADTLSEEDFEYMTETLADYTLLGKGGGKFVPLKDEMEFHFSGNYGELFGWLGFALRTNYLGFIKGQGGLAGLFQKAMEKASQSQSTSTGTPTESPPANTTAAA